VPDDKARAAAQAVAQYDRDIAELKAGQMLLKWMVGFNLAFTMAISSMVSSASSVLSKLSSMVNGFSASRDRLGFAGRFVGRHFPEERAGEHRQKVGFDGRRKSGRGYD
jgi:hypothetical protein